MKPKGPGGQGWSRKKSGTRGNRETPQDWPGQKARRMCLLLFIVLLVETWDLLRRMEERTVNQKLGVENKYREGKGS